MREQAAWAAAGLAMLVAVVAAVLQALLALGAIAPFAFVIAGASLAWAAGQHRSHRVAMGLGILGGALIATVALASLLGLGGRPALYAWTYESGAILVGAWMVLAAVGLDRRTLRGSGVAAGIVLAAGGWLPLAWLGTLVLLPAAAWLLAVARSWRAGEGPAAEAISA